MRRTLLLCFFLLAGVLLGALAADFAAGVPGISWLAFSKSIQFHPVLDLSVLSLDLNCTMQMSVAQVITIALALFWFYRNNY